MKQKYYRLNKILKHNAKYNMIFGERSNGKTFAVLEYGLNNYLKTGEQMAIVRRWADDFKGNGGKTMFAGVVAAGVLKKAGCVWTDVWYQAGAWYLCWYDENNNRITDERPFAFAFGISIMERYKSTSYPGITTILFDEFLTRSVYIPDEFILFCNILSTIIRDRDNVLIFMCGNTVNKYCPYFAEMGLNHVRDMKPGDIDVYNYGESDMKVAVEYTLPNAEGKKSDTYFAFDNPKLSMITSGSWEIGVYPHLPEKYKPKHVLYTFFICFDGDILQCEIVALPDKMFLFIHRKTTELKEPDSDLIFSQDFDSRPNWRRNILKPTDKISRKIYDIFKADKVFYADNEIGEIVRNYVQWCSKN